MYLQFIDCVIDASSFFIVVDTFVTNVRINDDIYYEVNFNFFIYFPYVFIFIIIFIENNFLLTSPIFILKYSIAIILVL